MTNIAALSIGILDGDDIGHEIVPAASRSAAARPSCTASRSTGGRCDRRTRARNARPYAAAGNVGDLKDTGRLDPRADRSPRLSQGAERDHPHPILRKQFNLFANVRPTRSYPDIGCLHDNVDLVIVRENNEGFQPDRNMVAGAGEFRPTDDVTLSCA